MKVLKDTWVIHSFALMHAAVSLVCQLVGIADDVMLTLLTMMLVVVICLRRKMGMIFMALAVVLVNIVGFALGMGFAALFKLFAFTSILVHPLATFLSTEIIGWSTEGCAFLCLAKRRKDVRVDAKSLRWLLFAFVVTITLRISILLFSSPVEVSTVFVVEILLDYIFSFMAIVWVSEYAIRSKAQAEQAREDADLARYNYQKLKRQVDPHFLFNSLNVLDYMIQEESTEQASEFTHKLAEVYRYMLKYEDFTTVKLREELSLLDNYVSLLKVRFSEGLELNLDIAEEYMSCSIVPCSLQLLMENAVKHNTVNSSDPLVVRIYVEEDYLVISNNIRPKITNVASTGLGLKYLKKQYEDIAAKQITILNAGGNYIVKLPLL